MAKPKRIYRLKVTLRYSRPPIWRRLKVYDDVTLYELHQILQVAMRWENSHLHMFRQGRTFFGEPDPEFGPDCIDETRTRLREVLLAPKDKLTYDYDFGDSWEHQVVLEAIEDPDPNDTYPMVVAGKRLARPKMLAAFPAMMSSWTPSPTRIIPATKRCATGMADHSTPMPSTSKRSISRSSRPVGRNAVQEPSAPDIVHSAMV